MLALASKLFIALVEWIADQLRFPRKPRCHFDHLHIWDSWKARIEVWRLKKIFKRYGPVDHIAEVVAHPRFRGSGPLSLSYETDASRYQCSIILNARRAEYFKRWPSRLRFMRTLWFLQAFFSSLESRAQFEAGDRHLLSNRGVSPEIATSQIVEDMRGRYRVLRKVERVLRETFRARDGAPLTMAALYSENSSWPVMEAITASLAALPETVSKQLAALQRRSTDEGTMWQACSAAVMDILGNLVSFAVAFDETTDWTWRQARLFDNEVFARFFGESWPTLHGDLRASMLRDYQGNKENEDSKQAVKEIFARMGIRVRGEVTGSLSALEVTPPVVPPTA